MARKRYSDGDVLKLLREIDVRLDVVSACRKAGISDKVIITGVIRLRAASI